LSCAREKRRKGEGACERVGNSGRWICTWGATATHVAGLDGLFNGGQFVVLRAGGRARRGVETAGRETGEARAHKLHPPHRMMLQELHNLREHRRLYHRHLQRERARAPHRNRRRERVVAHLRAHQAQSLRHTRRELKRFLFCADQDDNSSRFAGAGGRAAAVGARRGAAPAAAAAADATTATSRRWAR
jgi:hypothetical protein